MKILLFTCSLNSGGRERQLVEFIKGLCHFKDINFELAVMSRKIHYSELNNLNIKIHFLIRANKKDPKVLMKLHKICRVFQPDILHAWDSMASVYAVPIAKKLRIAFINGMIRDAPPKMKPFNKVWLRSKLTFPFSDMIVANSQAGLKTYKAPQNRCTCIYNGFDARRINIAMNADSLKEKFNINSEKVVGMVATFSKKKDYHTFITASQMLLRERNDLIFLTIGAGDTLEKCKELVKGEFRQKIRFLAEQKDVESIVNIFNVGVLATDPRYHGEGISNSIMEYMAFRKPVIATDVGGNKEIVMDGATGFLVKPLDVNDMYVKIKTVLEISELADTMGRAGKERLLNHFSLGKMTESYVSLYDRTLIRLKRASG